MFSFILLFLVWSIVVALICKYVPDEDIDDPRSFSLKDFEDCGIVFKDRVETDE